MTPRKFSLFLVATLLAAFSAHAESEPDIPWSKLRDTASRYLEACAAPKDVAGMAKRFKQRVQQRLEDSDTLGEDSVMRSLMLDWAAANDGRIKRKEKEAVMQACFYFVTFIDKGFLVPQQIRARLTTENQKEIFDHLEAEISKAKDKKQGAHATPLTRAGGAS